MIDPARIEAAARALNPSSWDGEYECELPAKAESIEVRRAMNRLRRWASRKNGTIPVAYLDDPWLAGVFD